MKDVSVVHFVDASVYCKAELIPVICHVLRSCLGSLVRVVERTQTRLDLERYVWSIPRKLIVVNTGVGFRRLIASPADNASSAVRQRMLQRERVS